MKNLLIILFIILIGCEKEGITRYTFYQGANNASPTEIITPHIGQSLHYSFRLGAEWEDGLLCTDKSHGCKLPALGALDYHDSGINADIMFQEDSGLVFHPRYYQDNVLHMLPGEVIQSGVWYSVTIQADPLRWHLWRVYSL